jgi:hypothetical protein
MIPESVYDPLIIWFKDLGWRFQYESIKCCFFKKNNISLIVRLEDGIISVKLNNPSEDVFKCGLANPDFFNRLGVAVRYFEDYSRRVNDDS